MRRALVLPVSAAVVGALLAIGVSALDRASPSSGQFRVVVDRSELAEVEIDLSEVEDQIAEAMEAVERIEWETEVRIERDVLREVREQLRTELRSAVEARDLTESEQERVREAMERLEEQLPAMMELSELVDGVTKEDGSAHKRSND